ncbi:MAG: hypothetical protein GEU26_18675 [Nitrososphaeraceae archaeon]|nr:hypothetical protein [Nitrososphaeraceae archaeon]
MTKLAPLKAAEITRSTASDSAFLICPILQGKDPLASINNQIRIIKVGQKPFTVNGYFHK